jgi:tRNA/rRNA methyltransferase
MSLAQGRKGPARGGVLDGTQAELLRTLLAERNVPRNERTPARGLAKLLRRNPTEAERVLWQALTSDRRFAGRSFKRQTPVGPHIADFVSFPLKCVIELVPDEEGAAAQTREERRVWLEAHAYKVVTIPQAAVETDLSGVLDGLADVVAAAG